MTITGINETLKHHESTSPKMKYFPIVLDVNSINKETIDFMIQSHYHIHYSYHLIDHFYNKYTARMVSFES